MKILHCCLSNFYIDDYNYQENVLPKIHFKQGHDVKIIASTETYIDSKQLGYVKPSTYYSNDGIEITRVPYKKYLPHFLMRKIRNYENVKEFLDKYRPDIIMFHGVSAFELFTFSKYKKDNPNVRFYVDNHADDNNSANNFISRYFLHKLFYKNILKKNIEYIDKILYITPESKDFLIKYYKVPINKMEFYPLGGRIINKDLKITYRIEKRKELGLSDEDIVLCHSGKMDQKKKTYELIENFSKIQDHRFYLVIIGSFTDEVKLKVQPLIEANSRILYLGWKNSDELIKYIASADLYVQPGGQSATMQNALCAGTPVLIKNVKSHQIYMKGNAFSIDNYNEMEKIFKSISNNPIILKNMSNKAYELSKEFLDYEKLAKRILK